MDGAGAAAEIVAPGDGFGEGPIELVDAGAVLEIPEGAAAPLWDAVARQGEELSGCDVKHHCVGLR